MSKVSLISEYILMKNDINSSFPIVSSNIQFTGEMASGSALYINAATIAIVGQGGMKDLKRSSGGNYRIVSIAGASAKVHLENLKIMNGYVSSSIFVVQKMWKILTSVWF